MKKTILLLSSLILWTCNSDFGSYSPGTGISTNDSKKTHTFIEKEVLIDKIRGGLLGQIIGNLNGIPHEMKYIDEPGNGTEYEPSLPRGAWTDDDTDFEWVYIRMIQLEQEPFLSPAQLSEIWKKSINTRIWCSNRYARHLMDLDIKPPYTGKLALNPWAEFNISGQFISETFGLVAPAMPQTAAKIGLNYTKITIDNEPAQTTQLFTSMIATAFVEDDLNRILDAGVKSIDPSSRVYKVISDVRRWHERYPDNWKTTRRLLKNKYSQANGEIRDRNGYELNTGATIAALLYGETDFIQTMITGFNYGWDADNVTATAGTILGVIKGYRWIMSQGWLIIDRYRNETRENMPDDETITSFADRVIEVAELVIQRNGGKIVYQDGISQYKIAIEEPAVVEPLSNPESQIADLKRLFEKDIESGIRRGRTREHRARAAYLAICLDMTEDYQKRYPELWLTAVQDLSGYWKIMQNIFFDTHNDFEAKREFQRKFESAGVIKPREAVSDDEIWYLETEWVVPQGR